jgi:hypothetical protein
MFEFFSDEGAQQETSQDKTTEKTKDTDDTVTHDSSDL